MTFRSKFALATAVLSLADVVVATTEATTNPPTTSPTKKPSATPTSAPTAYVGTGEWYADTANGNLCSKDCATSDGGECGGINHDTATWQTTFADATTCCSQKFNYLDNDYCVDRSSLTPDGTGKFYADTTTKSCLVDDDPSKGPFHAGALFDDAEKCCAGSLGWVNSLFCQSRSTGGLGGLAYTNKWYVDYQDMICKKDCPAGSSDECELTTDGSTSNTLFDDVSACCKGKLGWIPEDTCKTVSEGGTVVAVATEKYYADYKSSPARCAKDCDTADPTCAGELLGNVAGIQMFDDAASCCAGKFNWMDPDRCEALTTKTHTYKWYVDYQSNSCKQDCPAGGTCGGSPPDLSMQLFDDEETCCAQKLGWVQKDACIAKSSGAATSVTGTLKWHASYDAGTCKMDCAAGVGSPTCGGILANTAGEQLFDAQADCCAAKFGWVDKDLCVAMGAGGYSGKFYVDYADNACKQDCAPGTDNCGGNPSDKSIQMFDDADACCANKLSYLNKSACVAKSTGVASAAVGSGKWYVDWSISKCAKDCVAGSDVGCGGLAESWEKAEYDDWGACCGARLNWLKDEDCHT